MSILSTNAARQIIKWAASDPIPLGELDSDEEHLVEDIDTLMKSGQVGMLLARLVVFVQDTLGVQLPDDLVEDATQLAYELGFGGHIDPDGGQLNAIDLPFIIMAVDERRLPSEVLARVQNYRDTAMEK